MSDLPVAQILDHTYNAAHFNHVHVSGSPMKTGTPPLNYPGWTDAIEEIYDALEAAFGPGAYFVDVDHHWEDGKFVIDDPDIKWTHMGVYNRRPIAGSTTWSQHAWANGLDIGPYYGDDQAPFVEFLKSGKLPDMKETKPDWLPDSLLQDLLDAGILTSIPTEETLDFWRLLTFLGRMLDLIADSSALDHKHVVKLTASAVTGVPI